MQILVVDDNPADRELIGLVIGQQLPRVGILGAGTPLALAENLAERAFDVAIIERQLDWADGLDVIETLRRVRPDCAVILFSRERTDSRMQWEARRAPDEYLYKDSIGFLTLPLAIRRQLRRKAGAGAAPDTSVPRHRSQQASGSASLPGRPDHIADDDRTVRRARSVTAPPRSDIVRLVQLTDTHLFGDSDGRLLGQNTRKTFELVLDLMLARSWPADGILLTGDMIHDESREGYCWLVQRLAELDIPCNCLPGNHDGLRVLVGTLNGSPISFAPSANYGPWHIVFLDTSIPGSDAGHLHADQLEALDETLRGQRSTHTLICLHHQPVPVGSAWLDTMALDNADEFFSVVDSHPQVRGVLFGHVHQDFQHFRKDTILLAAPSTCVQFLPGSREFALDLTTPGYRWIDLYPDGRIATGVERIAAYPEPIDRRASGY